MRKQEQSKDMEDFPVQLAWAAGDGACAGAVFALALVWLDIRGLGTMLRGSSDGDLWFFLMVAAMASTMAMVGVVKLVLGIAEHPEDEDL